MKLRKVMAWTLASAMFAWTFGRLRRLNPDNRDSSG